MSHSIFCHNVVLLQVSTLPSTGSPGGKGGKGRKIMASMKKSFRSLRQIGSTRKSPGTERKRHSEPDFYQSSNNKFYPGKSRQLH